MPRSLIVFLLACALAACGPSPAAVSTSLAQTQAAERAQLTAQAQTATAGAPTAAPTNTAVPTATATDLPSATPTATATPTTTVTPPPTGTPTATLTATPAPTNTQAPPAATPVPPTTTPPPAPDFVTIATDVRTQMNNVGWQLDLGMRYYENIGSLDCTQVIYGYDFVAARHDLSLPATLAAPYALYQSGVEKFTTTVFDIYTICQETPTETRRVLKPWVPRNTLSIGRIGIYDATALITQAIVAAGGTP